MMSTILTSVPNFCFASVPTCEYTSLGRKQGGVVFQSPNMSCSVSAQTLGTQLSGCYPDNQARTYGTNTQRRCRPTRIHASQHRVGAWRHISSHLLALTTATSGLTCPSVCALPRPSRSCHAAELPIVQPDIRHSTDVRSAPGAQVDPLSLGITEGIPFVLFGFRNVLVRARRMCLAALGPTVHHHRRSRSQA